MSLDLGGSAKTSHTNQDQKGVSTETQSGTQTQETILNMDAINKIINDTLGGPGGLKDIFGAEKGAGLYNSSTSSLLAGNFASQLVGELAKLTAKTTNTVNGTNSKIFDNWGSSTTNEAEVAAKGKVL